MKKFTELQENSVITLMNKQKFFTKEIKIIFKKRYSGAKEFNKWRMHEEHR